MRSSTNKKVAVVGAGAWGTAIALQLLSNGNDVTLWARNHEQLAQMEKDAENQRYLPGVSLPAALKFNADLQAVVAQHDHVIMVVPSHSFRSVLKDMRPALHANSRITWATKGLELASGKFLHSVLEEEVPDVPVAIISGPSFATEMSIGQPTVMTAASTNTELQKEVVQLFHGGNLRIYPSDDVLGVEIGGAVKNVLAIATGIADGLGYGANTQAALITRGLAEMVRFGNALGARAETLMGVSGVGDLVLTCTDNQSRNRRMGLYLGQGKSMQEATEEIGQALEGVKTAGVIMQVAESVNVEMPLSEMVYRILYHEQSTKDAVGELLARGVKREQ